MIAYRYDGSFPGFLCCVWDALEHKIEPTAFLLWEDGPTLWKERRVPTDENRARRLYAALAKRVSGRFRHFSGERLALYDRTNREIFLSDRGRWEILPAENFQMGPAGETERSFRALWRNYFKAIAIEGRINPKCQSTHMPKRYRHVMTEFMADEIKNALGERTGKEP